jgi:hypothetical protein
MRTKKHRPPLNESGQHVRKAKKKRAGAAGCREWKKELEKQTSIGNQ